MTSVPSGTKADVPVPSHFEELIAIAAVDLPEANDLTAGVMALVAQQKRLAISRRTKEALSGHRQSLSCRPMMSKLQPTSDTLATPHIVEV